MSQDHRGVLYPVRLPTFVRLPPPAAVADLVRWFWIPEWQIAPGRVSRQHLIAFPASNLVVGPDGVELSGPSTRRSYRDLRGTGWAVGALLRPAAVSALTTTPNELRDATKNVEAPELHARVVEAMSKPQDRHQYAVRAFADWLVATMPPPSAEGLLANTMAELIDEDSEVRKVEDVAGRLHISVRSVQRLARRYVGLTPLTMIRRRRLQEAAQQLRDNPAINLAELAAELGYADQAHLTGDFSAILGLTPGVYRNTP